MLKQSCGAPISRRCGYAVMETAAKSGAGVKEFVPAVRALLSEKLQRYAEKRAGRAHDPRDGRRNPQCGQVHLYQPRGRQDPCQGGKPAGRNPLQSVGQCGRQPGTLDTPGILWPKFEDQAAALRLAFIGAIRDEVMDLEELACALMEFLARDYPACLLSATK